MGCTSSLQMRNSSPFPYYSRVQFPWSSGGKGGLFFMGGIRVAWNLYLEVYWWQVGCIIQLHKAYGVFTSQDNYSLGGQKPLRMEEHWGHGCISSLQVRNSSLFPYYPRVQFPWGSGGKGGLSFFMGGIRAAWNLNLGIYWWQMGCIIQVHKAYVECTSQDNDSLGGYKPLLMEEHQGHGLYFLHPIGKYQPPFPILLQVPTGFLKDF